MGTMQLWELGQALPTPHIHEQIGLDVQGSRPTLTSKAASFLAWASTKAALQGGIFLAAVPPTMADGTPTGTGRPGFLGHQRTAAMTS
jgi:hypothetical protein